MNDKQWSEVDNYLVSLLTPSDEALLSALADSEAAGLPPISVAPNQGKMLELLARMCTAQRILEIGTLGGYSTISLARALPPIGKLITLELEPAHARVARANLDRAGLEELADKEGYPEYLELSLALAHLGTVIVADNIVRDGQVANLDSTDERVRGVRLFLELAAADPRVNATAIQTVGSKGYDGFALLLVV